jgi:phage/plasmid-like protein (TIGR03299 family)
MSHNIEQHDRMVSANNMTPWHRLGEVVPGSLTPDEAFEIVRLGWNVSKHQAFTRVLDRPFDDVLMDLVVANSSKPGRTIGEILVETGIDIPIDGKFATVRDDLNYPLGVVGTDYTCFQNTSGWALVKALLSGGDIEIETAGTLRNGRQVWVLVKLHRDLTIGGDEHTPYLLFVWSHDGTSGLRVVPTPVRVVCNNTLRMALSAAKSSWTARHTNGIDIKATEIAQTLNLTWKFYDEFEKEVEKLIDTTVTEMRFEEILETIVPDPEKDKEGKVSERKLNNAIDRRGSIRKLYNLDDRVGEFKGTGWGVVQAFSTFDLWGGRVNGGEDKRSERQANRILTGDTMANITQVRELVLA